MKITNLKSVKADSIATVELSQVRVEMQQQKQNTRVRTFVLIDCYFNQTTCCCEVDNRRRENMKNKYKVIVDDKIYTFTRTCRWLCQSRNDDRCSSVVCAAVGSGDEATSWTTVATGEEIADRWRTTTATKGARSVGGEATHDTSDRHRASLFGRSVESTIQLLFPSSTARRTKQWLTI